MAEANIEEQADMLSWAIEQAAIAAEKILNTVGDIPPFGIAFFEKGRQTVAPLADASDSFTHSSLLARVHAELSSIVRQRSDVLAVATILCGEDVDLKIDRVFIQVESPKMMAPPYVLPLVRKDDRFDFGEPYLFEQRIAGLVFPR
jgi:hypothetical protein